MGVLDKCCGNCARSFGKDMDGYCACGVDNHFTSCDEVCDNHIMSLNGWIEITPDNVDEVDCIDQEKVVVGWLDNKGRQHIAALVDCPPVKSSLAGKGYYYYVLPELKIK